MNADAQILQQAYLVVHVCYVRQVRYPDRLIGEQRGTEDLQGFVLFALRYYFAR